MEIIKENTVCIFENQILRLIQNLQESFFFNLKMFRNF